LPCLYSNYNCSKKPAAESLARKLVVRCARVKDKDLVQISGPARNAALMEDLAVEVARLGGDPLLTLLPSDRGALRLFTEVPEKYDSRTSPLALKLAGEITVSIFIDSVDSDAVLEGVPGKRVQARQKAQLAVIEAMQKRNVRMVNLGNNMYPTEARAKSYGMTRAELAKQFLAGLDVDYDRLQKTGETVRKALAGGDKVRVTSPEGTDVMFRIGKRTPLVSDGVIGDDKIKKGGAACQAWLPAGEVFTTVVPDTAEGKVVIERSLWEGKEVRGLTLTFKKGKLVEMTARSGLKRLKENYEAGGEGRDEFSFLDIGINPAVKMPKDSPGQFVEAGTISIGTGNNIWAGGDNKSSFGMTGFVRGGTLTLDGKTLVKDGKLQIKE
jgi:leucyl aminopeptidase (aminopeptidase T)